MKEPASWLEQRNVPESVAPLPEIPPLKAQVVPNTVDLDWAWKVVPEAVPVMLPRSPVLCEYEPFTCPAVSRSMSVSEMVTPAGMLKVCNPT